MLLTAKSDELAEHSRLLGRDIQVWRNVQIESEKPHFMVIYVVREAGFKVRQTCLVWRHEDLIALCDLIEADPCTGLVRVNLLSPPWMNGSEMWRIDAVKEIWSAEHSESSCYILENSTHLLDAPVIREAADWNFVKAVFQIEKYERFLELESA